MNRFYFCLLILLLAGCGENSTDNYTTPGGGSEELDGGNTDNYIMTSPNARGTQLADSAREFDVNLFNFEPIYKESTLHLSSKDTFKITLQTLALLTEEKRYPLIQADKIIQNGVPQVIPPKGYSVTLEVEGNKLIAVMKSTTRPDAPPRVVKINTGNNDIIIGDLTPKLLISSVNNGAAFNKKTIFGVNFQRIGAHIYQYASYNIYDNWFGQLGKTSINKDTQYSGLIGKYWDINIYSYLMISFQHLQQARNRKSINALTVKYEKQWLNNTLKTHMVFATTVDFKPLPAVGGGGQYNFLPKSDIYLNLVCTPSLWDASLGFNISW